MNFLKCERKNCFANKKGECIVLNAIPKKCRFFKTAEQLEKERKKSTDSLENFDFI